ncbi:probable serine/threonine-protein kinase DDB_G0282963 isoform X1 [Rhopalosiphum maidis]|uniref:probable serine/threonine-protein kinase DDB_G0282963 isoform X1 n=1 Tax=Rhopalosiphum maidis TaxID=43146 RepID=UPI000EFFF4F2|nr:probable serine/threonine-protein kinase DDB_G0282963 isoform X1 [Rhopalosiphum maidis]XP_026820048.1 probable serine/threonine-protein kinase DDB_G0282963 isoform X1 [Rhopalosiphum maidis]
MTYINNAIMLIEEVAGNMSNKHNSKVQDKNIWKSLRTHILSRREKNKQAEVDAEVLRKKKCVEYQKMQENKLSLAQINGRLTQLRDKRDELEEEKRALLNQSQAADDSMATALVVPKTESNCEPINNKTVVTNNINNVVVTNHRPTPLLQQQQHIYRQQTTVVNSHSGAGSPAAGSGLSPLAQQSLMMHNSSTSNTGGSNQTLLVCSPATINAANNQNNNVTRSTMSLPASLSSTMSFTKFPPLYSSSTTHLLAPNVGTSNKMGRTPSPQPQTMQQQNYQQPQIVVPFPPYKSMNNSGSTTNNLNSTTPASVVNSINQSLASGTNSNYPIENSNRRGNREDTTQSFNRNVWINNSNNTNKNTQPNVSNYGSFYQPNSTTAVNYCVNNGMLSSAPSLSSVNTVYSYSGPPPPPPPPPPRTESSNSGNLIVSTAGDHGAQQIPKPLSSHQHHQPHHHVHSHPPMYMSPGIRNQTSNHTYHPKPPHSVYPDDKLGPPPVSNFYQQGSRNIHLSNTTTVTSQPHQMQNQKPHNIGYPMRHPTAASPASQLSPAIIQSSQHALYTVPTSSVTGYSNKLPATAASTADIPRYQQPSQTPMSRHE